MRGIDLLSQSTQQIEPATLAAVFRLSKGAGAMVTVLEERRRPARSYQPNQEIRLKRVLVVVDGFERMARVLEYVISHAVSRGPIDAVLLYVQPPAKRGGTPSGPGYSGDSGRLALNSAAHRLDHVGIVNRERVEIGDRGAAIVKCAEEERCDLIVLADTGRSLLGELPEWKAGLAVRSMLKQAVHQTGPIEVVIVK
jgi:nucleotide-binding universal stress UspA family protein